MNFLYTGDFTDDLTDILIDVNNDQFKNRDEFVMTQRKVGFLIAECFQNIVRHGEFALKEGYFHTKNDKGVFSIISGNVVHNDSIETLRAQLEQLNRLTSEELRDHYKKVLKEGTLSQKGGAGLGLIEMARKSKNKLSFRFAPIDSICSYFYFQLQLKTPQYIDVERSNNIEKSILLREKMKLENIFLIYKGLLSVEIPYLILQTVHPSIKSIRQKDIYLNFIRWFKKLDELKWNSTQALETMIFIGDDQSKFHIAGVKEMDIDFSNTVVRYLDEKTKEDKNELRRQFEELHSKSEKSTDEEMKELLLKLMIANVELQFKASDTTKGASQFTLAVSQYL